MLKWFSGEEGEPGSVVSTRACVSLLEWSHCYPCQVTGVVALLSAVMCPAVTHLQGFPDHYQALLQHPSVKSKMIVKSLWRRSEHLDAFPQI